MPKTGCVPELARHVDGHVQAALRLFAEEVMPEFGGAGRWRRIRSRQQAALYPETAIERESSCSENAYGAGVGAAVGTTSGVGVGVAGDSEVEVSVSDGLSSVKGALSVTTSTRASTLSILSLSTAARTT